jgi:LAGLIDADG endonuclease
MPLDLNSYVSGFVDGEGCFCVSFQPSVRHALGWEGRPSFSVSQNADRAQLLHVLQRRWGCGSIRPDRSDDTLKFEVRSLRELVGAVIPHFEEHPLVSAKQLDFDSFKEVCQRMQRGEHRNCEWVREDRKGGDENELIGQTKVFEPRDPQLAGCQVKV